MLFQSKAQSVFFLTYEIMAIDCKPLLALLKIAASQHVKSLYLSIELARRATSGNAIRAWQNGQNSSSYLFDLPIEQHPYCK